MKTRESVRLRRIADDAEKDAISGLWDYAEILRQAADEIEALADKAYRPPSQHPAGCDCLQCVPF